MPELVAQAVKSTIVIASAHFAFVIEIGNVGDASLLYPLTCTMRSLTTIATRSIPIVE